MSTCDKLRKITGKRYWSLGDFENLVVILQTVVVSARHVVELYFTVGLASIRFPRMAERLFEKWELSYIAKAAASGPTMKKTWPKIVHVLVTFG